MRRSRLFFASAVVLLLGLAFIFNPSAEKHRAAIKQAVAERSPTAGALGFGAIAAHATSYHSWGFCSYSTLNERVVSVGALGMVHVRALLPPK